MFKENLSKKEKILRLQAKAIIISHILMFIGMLLIIIFLFLKKV